MPPPQPQQPPEPEPVPEPEPEPEPEPPASSDSDSDDDLLGFGLFEGETPKAVRAFDFGEGLQLSVTCLDEDPIGVQVRGLLTPLPRVPDRPPPPPSSRPA